MPDELVDLLPSSKTPEEIEAERLALEAEEDEGKPNPQLEAAKEIERLKAMAARFAPLQDVADELDSDPGKIFNVRAALRGQAPQNQPTPAPQNLTPEQMERLDEQFRDKPSQFTAAAAQLAARQELAEFYRNVVEPVIEASGEGRVDSYKAQRNDDPLYKQIAVQFDKEMGDIDRKALSRAPAKEQKRQMDLRWQAAKAQVLQKAMDESTIHQTDTAKNLGRGGSGAPSGARAKLARDPELVRLALATGGISKEELEAIVGQASDYQE